MKLITYTPANPLSAWTPFHRLSPWSGLFESAFGHGADTWTPSLDLRDDGTNLVVELELAGMKKENFDISLEDGTLAISGSRHAAENNANSGLLSSERFSGRFSRTVALPCAVKADAVTATYKDGILAITLPKADEARPRKIDIKLN